MHVYLPAKEEDLTKLDEDLVAVIGAGTMGSGIATVIAKAGFPTLLFDQREEQTARGVESTTKFLRKSAQLGKLTDDQAEAAIARVEGTADLGDLRRASIVIEAILEDRVAKSELFGALDDIVAEDALFHTNTSTLSVTAIAAGSKRPERVVGTHYCNPAPLMKLVEVAPGRHTAQWAVDRTRDFLDKLGKTSVLTKDRPGFIVNRFLIPWENRCIEALEQGRATKEGIDAAVTGALGHPMGPFRLLDIVGLDIHQQVATRLYEQLRDPRFFPPPMVERMVSAGDLGRKVGRGFYEYDSAGLFGA